MEFMKEFTKWLLFWNWHVGVQVLVLVGYVQCSKWLYRRIFRR